MHGSRFSLPAVLALVLVSSPLAGQLLVPGAERRLSDPQLGAAFGYQFGGSVAANSAEFVASWMTNGRVFASRIDSRGLVLDPGGVPLPFTDIPTLAGMGNGFLAIGRDGTRLRSVSFTNDLLIDASNDVGDFDYNSYLRGVATSGSKAFVLMQVGDGLRGRVINELSRPESDWISFGSQDSRRVALIASPEGFVLLVAKDIADRPGEQALYAQRISVTGQLYAWQQVMVAGFADVQRIRASFDGVGIIIAWSTQRDLKAAVLSAETLEASAPFAITPAREYYGSPPLVSRIVARASRSFIFFTDVSVPGGLAVATVDDRTRTVTSGAVVAADGHPDTLAVALGATLLIVWPHDGGAADLDLYARQLDAASGAPIGEPLLVSHSAHEQQSPRVASTGSIDLVVWSEVDTDANTTRIMAMRLNREGGVLDQPFTLSEAGHSCATPDVAFDGEHFVVVWNDSVTRIYRSGRVVARRVGLDGRLVDGVPIVIADAATPVASTPVIACGDDRCLVAWTTGRQIGTAILTRSGAVTSSMFMGAEDNPADAQDPHVAFGGGTFAVGWRSFRWFGGHSPVYTASRLAFFTREGLPTVGLHLRDILMDSAAEAPYVGWNGSDFVAAWQVNSILHAARFSPAGVSLGPTAMVDMTGATGKLSGVAYVGGAWLLSIDVMTSSRIAGIYLRDNEALSRVLTFTIEGDGRDPGLASVGNHAVFVYRRRVTDTPFGGANRVFLRELDVIAAPETSLPRRRSAKS